MSVVLSSPATGEANLRERACQSRFWAICEQSVEKCWVRLEPGDLPELAAFRCRASLNFELYRFPILKGGNPERRHNSRQTIRMYDTYLDVPVYSGCRVCTFPNAAFCRFDPCWCANPNVCLFSRLWAGNGFVPLKSRRALLPTHVLWTCTPESTNSLCLDGKWKCCGAVSPVRINKRKHSSPYGTTKKFNTKIVCDANVLHRMSVVRSNFFDANDTRQIVCT